MAVFLAFATISCKEESMGEIPDETASPNILLIIADDLGKDAIKGYSEGLIKPNTPNIDLIRTKGLLFNNFGQTLSVHLPDPVFSPVNTGTEPV